MLENLHVVAKLPEMRRQDVLAVALHAKEVGRSADWTESAVLARVPELFSTPDAHATDPVYPKWVRLLRTVGRLKRLRELEEPEMMITKDHELCTAIWSEIGTTPWVAAPSSWPEDLHALAVELGLS